MTTRRSWKLYIGIGLALLTGQLPPARAGGLEDMLKNVGRSVQAIQKSVSSPIKSSESAMERAVRDAPEDVVAARLIFAEQARLSVSTVNAPTVSEMTVRSATSLLDAEPGVKSFQDKLRSMAPSAPGKDGQPDNTRVYLGVAVSGFSRVVALLDANAKFLCTGTVISPRHILTATHCLCDESLRLPDQRRLRYAVSGPDLLSARVVGELDEARAEWMGAGSICYGNLEDPDVAVVGFSGPMAIGLPSLRIATDQEIDSSGQLRVVGYGKSTIESSSIGTKRAALVPVVSPRCEGRVTAATADQDYSTEFRCVRGAEILAGRTAGADTCKGDSGGPAFLAPLNGPGDIFVDDIEPTKLVIAGVTSRGVKPPEGAELADCGYGGIYVRVSDPVRSFLKPFL